MWLRFTWHHKKTKNKKKIIYLFRTRWGSRTKRRTTLQTGCCQSIHRSVAVSSLWATCRCSQTSSQSSVHTELGPSDGNKKQRQRKQQQRKQRRRRRRQESPTCAFSICSNDSNRHTLSNRGQTPPTGRASKWLLLPINTAAARRTGSPSALQKTEGRGCLFTVIGPRGSAAFDSTRGGKKMGLFFQKWIPPSPRRRWLMRCCDAKTKQIWWWDFGGAGSHVGMWWDRWMDGWMNTAELKKPSIDRA